MPIEPAAIRRQLAAGAALELREAKRKADQSEEAAEDRRPDDGLTPQGTVRAQRADVEPMRNRAEPIPEALVCGRKQHHLAGGAGDIDGGTRRIVERIAVERPVRPVISAYRPLVALDEIEDGGLRRSFDDALGGTDRNRARFGLIDFERGTGGSEAGDAARLALR